MQKIKQGDEVIVITGRDKGKRGNVMRVTRDGRLFVSGVNMVKRHTRPNPQLNQPGGIIEKEAPIQRSNVMLFDPKQGKGDRVGIRQREDGTRVRVFRSTGEQVDG